MHELSITQHLLSLTTRHAEQQRARRVTSIHLAIGELSSFVDDSVRFCWDYLSRGTICEGATLFFRRVPAEMTCLDCGSIHGLDGGPAPCPSCGSSRLKITNGADLVLESLDLEVDSDETEAEERTG
jgi:hydrogenase nickel incorporation protein HypA/HybF